MKSASVSDLRNNFAVLSRAIYEGQSVAIKKRGKIFAILTPPQKKRKHPTKWPAFEKRLKRNFPKGILHGMNAEEIINTLRGEY